MTFDTFTKYFNKDIIMFKLPTVEMILAQQGIKLPDGSMWHDDLFMEDYKDCYGRTLYDIKFKYINE